MWYAVKFQYMCTMGGDISVSTCEQFFVETFTILLELLKLRKWGTKSQVQTG